MKKLSLLLFTAFVTGNNDRIKALKIFFLAFLFCCISNVGFAQVTVTPASGGGAICFPNPPGTLLGTITITETTNADFASGADQLIITPPAGWQFVTTSVPTYSTIGGDIVATPTGGLFTSTSLTINITSTGIALHDQITISNITVQPLTPSAAPGYISASSVTGIFNIVGTTDFGDLALFPGVIAGNLSICAGGCTTLSDLITGGVWTSSISTVATIDPVTGVACSPNFTDPTGTTTILYSKGGCAASAILTVNQNPTPIVGVHDICQNNCYNISDAVIVGNSNFFTSTLVTVTNTPPLGTTGKATLCGVNAGAATVTYTLTSGCFIITTLTVNPLPQPIIDPTGTYRICQGSSTFLTDATTGGVWSSSHSSIATITPGSGDLFGVSSGLDTITYTLPVLGTAPAGCAIDTPFRVNPIPLPISGIDSVCVGSTVRLSDVTPGGTWSSSNTNFATVTTGPGAGGGVVAGVSAGVVTITYTINAGCYVTYSVTVHAVPDPITGPTMVCATYSITLIETSVGGTWSSSNTYATVNSTTGIVTGSAVTVSGNDTVIYTFSTGCNAIYPITVNPLPAPITGSPVVCQGQCTQLSDATPNGSWLSSQPGFATVTSGPPTPPGGLVCGIQISTVNITYTLPTGCYVTFSETVNQLDQIVGPSSVCEGLTIGLSDATTPGTWSSSNTLVATVDSNSGVVLGVSATVGTPAGVAVISYTTSTGCIATATITVYPSPLPITGTTDSVCQGSSIYLTDATTGGAWSSSNTFIATVGSTGTVTGIIPGTVIIDYTLPAGCFSTYTVTINPLPGPILGPFSVCLGDSVTINDATPGGTWTSSNSSIAAIDTFSGMATGNNPGNVTITYTLPTSCLITATFTVNPITPISGDTVLCAGGLTITLSDATPGGTWSSGTPAATVTPGPGAGGGVVTGVNPGGVAIITYSLPTGCFATYTVLVNPQPAVIAGPTSVCVGQFITLSDATPGGTWSAANTHATVGSATGVVTGVSSGLDPVTYTLSSTGCYITTNILVNPLTPILPNGYLDVCVGYQINLSDATSPGTWSSSNTSIATITPGPGVTGGIVTGVSAGTDTISYTVSATGCTITTTLTVNPLPAPITGMTPVCVQSTITLSDATAGGTWSSGNTNIATIGSSSGIVTGVSGGTVHITFTLSTGCFVTTTVLVNPLPTPIIINGLPDICIYDTKTLLSDATPGGTWSSSSTVLVINNTNGVITGIDTGVAIVTYSLPTGCLITTTITVQPLPIVKITHTPPGTICVGGSTTLTASGAGPAGTYTWAPPYGLSNTTLPTVTASPTVTTTYTVTATTMYGCVDTGTTIVWVDTMLNHLVITGKDSICEGECDLLVITGGIDSVYLWKPATGLSCTNCDSTLACPVNKTTYWAIAVDFLGCKDSASFTVTVNPIPVLVVEPNPTIVCKRSTTNVTVSGAGAGGHYIWFPNLFIDCDTCANVVLSDTSNIVYEVTGTTEYGCKDSISVKVSVLDTNVNTISGDSIICIGKSVHLAAYSQSLTGNLDIPQFLWIPATGLNDPYINTPIATPNVTTVYTVIITENVCFKDTEHVQVTVEPLPEIIVTPVSATVIAGTSVQLLASAPNVVVSTFAWAPANSTLSCDTCDNPVATPTTSSITYTVTAVSNFGCIADTTVTIKLFCDNTQIFIPNTFTPNGDGVNDRFYISGKGISVITRFAIYNRWGQLLFEAHNININDAGAGWDGTYKGYVLEPDVFIYEVSALCELGAPFTYKGDVSIVR
ncbi:MAG: gliding motility-associated C-terminal domain-containing protein [Chitinophagales bacterium]